MPPKTNNNKFDPLLAAKHAVLNAFAKNNNTPLSPEQIPDPLNGAKFKEAFELKKRVIQELKKSGHLDPDPNDPSKLQANLLAPALPPPPQNTESDAVEFILNLLPAPPQALHSGMLGEFLRIARFSESVRKRARNSLLQQGMIVSQGSENETSYRRAVSSSPAAVSSSSAVVVQQPPPPSQKQGDKPSFSDNKQQMRFVDILAQGTVDDLRKHLASNSIPLSSLKNLHVNGHPYLSLHTAARWSNLEIVKFLLQDLKFDPAVTDGFGSTALHRAAQGGRVDSASLLVAHSPKLVDAVTSSDKDTALHQAASNGHAEFVLWLLKQPGGAKLVSLKNAHGQTACDLAVKRGHDNVARALGAGGLTPLPMTLVPVDHLLAAKHEVLKALRSSSPLPLKNIEPLNGVTDLHMKMEVINAMIAAKLITLDVKNGIVSLIKASPATTLPPAPNPNDLETACGCVLSILKNGEVFQSGTLGARLKASGFDKEIREIAINKLLSAGRISRRDEFPVATYSKVSQQQQVKSKAGKSNDDDDQQQLPPKKSHVVSSSSPAATIPDPEQKQQISATDNEAAGSESKLADIKQMVSLLSSAVQQQVATQKEKSGSFDGMSDDDEEAKYTEKELEYKLGEAQLKMTEQYNARADDLANHYKAEIHRLKSVHGGDMKKLRDELANEKATHASTRAELSKAKAANFQFALQQQAWQKQVDDAKKQAEDLNKKIAELQRQLAIAQQQIATASSPAAAASAATSSASASSTSPPNCVFGEFPALLKLATKKFDQHKLFQHNNRDFSKSTFRVNPCLQGGNAAVLSKFLLPSTCTSFFKDPTTKLELDTNKFELLFHGTPKQNVASILCNGLDAGRRRQQARGPGEYFGACDPLGFRVATGYGDGMLVVLVMKNQHYSNHDLNGHPIAVVNNCICHAKSTFCLPIGYATDDDSVPTSCASCIPAKPVAASSSSSGSFTTLLFQDDKRNWVPWNPAEAQPVLAAINSGRTATPLTGVIAAGGQFSYTIDFVNRVQINEQSNKQRVIRWI